MDLSLPFTKPYRVRFDEAAADGRVRPSALVRYLHDLAWQHSEAAGYDRAWHTARGVAWLVRGLSLELSGTADYGTTLSLTTAITGWRRMWCRRETSVTGPDAAPVARAWTDWVLLDASGRPARVPGDLAALAPEAATFTPTRVDLPDTPDDATRVASVARASDTDPMGHLNSAAYVDLVEEAARAAGRPIGVGTRIRLEYLVPALPGMALDLTAWQTPGSLAVRLREAGGSADLLRAFID